VNDDTTGTGPDPGEVLDARLAARLAALSATYSPRGEADAVAAERERIRQLAIRTHAVTVSRTGRMQPFEELLRHSPEENAALLLQVVEDARAARSPAVEGLQAPRPVVRVLPDQDGQQETAPAVTPGRAAYEASIGIIRDDFDGPPWAWEALPPRHRKVFDVAGEAAIEASGLRAELNEARAEMAEVRRIAYQGGQDAASVRHELLAYLEARDDA
jgi:hypothetical protein